MLKRIGIVLFLAAAGHTILYAQAPQEEDTLVIETYYPSPYGYYDQLMVDSRMAIGDLNGDGQTTEDDLAGGPDSTDFPGSLVVAGKVGIGTNNPGANLEVAGTIKTTNLQITSDAGSGKALTSDLTGMASWKNAKIVTTVKTLKDKSNYFKSKTPWDSIANSNEWNEGSLLCDSGYTRTGCSAFCSGIIVDQDLSTVGTDDSDGGGCRLGENDKCFGSEPVITLKVICSKITFS